MSFCKRLAIPALVLGTALGAASICWQTAATAADKPKAGRAAGRWGVKPDPPAEPLKWPETLNFTIPQPPNSDDVMFPTTPSQFCLTGLKAYESDQAELWT